MQHKVSGRGLWRRNLRSISCCTSTSRRVTCATKSTNVSATKPSSDTWLLCCVNAYLDGVLALLKRRTDLALLVVVGGGRHLGLELGLERPAKTQKHDEQLIMSKCGKGIGSQHGFAYRLASVRSSARASDHDANSAGVMLTDARERSRTLICDSTCVFTRAAGANTQTGVSDHC